MSMTDLPLVSMLKTKLHWHQTRQKVLADNVVNANTPGFQPKELREPRMPGAVGSSPSVAVERTSPLHLASVGSADDEDTAKASGFEARPSGNAVSLEDEMMKIAQNQSDYQLAATLYQKSLGLLKTAVSGAKS